MLQWTTLFNYSMQLSKLSPTNPNRNSNALRRPMGWAVWSHQSISYRESNGKK